MASVPHLTYQGPNAIPHAWWHRAPRSRSSGARCRCRRGPLVARCTDRRRRRRAPTGDRASSGRSVGRRLRRCRHPAGRTLRPLLRDDDAWTTAAVSATGAAGVPGLGTGHAADRRGDRPALPSGRRRAGRWAAGHRTRSSAAPRGAASPAAACAPATAAAGRRPRCRRGCGIVSPRGPRCPAARPAATGSGSERSDADGRSAMTADADPADLAPPACCSPGWA